MEVRGCGRRKCVETGQTVQCVWQKPQSQLRRLTLACGLRLSTLSMAQKYIVLRMRGTMTMTTTSSILGQGHRGVSSHTPASPSSGARVR